MSIAPRPTHATAVGPADQQPGAHVEETPDDHVAPSWRHQDGWPTARQRAGVEQSVRRVFELLVPDRAPPRHMDPRAGVQRYRSPRGCILQHDAWAVTLSWFPASASDETLGQLRVITWAGVVSRPGATHRAAGGARPVTETLFSPVESGAETWAWRSSDGRVLDTGELAEWCLLLLSEPSVPPGVQAAHA